MFKSLLPTCIYIFSNYMGWGISNFLIQNNSIKINAYYFTPCFQSFFVGQANAHKQQNP